MILVGLVMGVVLGGLVLWHLWVLGVWIGLGL